MMDYRSIFDFCYLVSAWNIPWILNHNKISFVNLPKFNSLPLNSYRAAIGKDRLPTTIFKRYDPRSLTFPLKINDWKMYFLLK